MTLSRPLLNTLAMLVIAGLLAALYGALHNHRLQAGLHGPTALDVDGKRVAVASQGRIDILDTRGRLLASHDSTALGIDPLQADVLLLGEQRLLVSYGADLQPALCDLGAGSCRPFLAGTLTGGPVKFARAGEYVLVVDSNRHRVLKVAADGGAATVVIDEHLAFPNGMLALADAWLLCDTNNARVLRFPLHDGEPGARTVVADDFGLAGSGRQRPVAIAPDPAGWWVLVADVRIRDAVMLRLDHRGTPIARVRLPPAGEPATLRALPDGSVLVADAGGFQLLAVNSDGHAAAFGDEAFRGRLLAEHGRLQAAVHGYRLSLSTLAVLLVVAMAIAWQEQRQRGRHVTTTVNAAVTWLPGPRAPALLSSTVILAVLLSLLSLPFALAVLTLGITGVALALLALPWVLAFLLLHLRQRQRQRAADSVAALGVSGGELVLRLGNGEEARYPLHRLPWSRRALHLPDRLVLLRDADGWLYPERQLQRHLWPRLSRRSRMGLG